MSSKGKKKHSWSYTDLQNRTQELINLTPGSSEANRVRSDDLFDTLEAWMELSGEGSGLSAAEQAQCLLQSLEANVGQSTVLVPTLSFYEVVLQAYAVGRGRKPAAEAAEKLLVDLMERCRHESWPVQPSVKCFNIVINCWAQSGASDAGKRAEEVLQMMDEWRRETNNEFWANERTISSVIHAWNRSGHVNGPERALALLQEAVEAKKDLSAGHRFHQVALDAIVFNSVLQTWAKSDRGRQAANKAEEIMRMMTETRVAPNTRTYAMVLDAWARCEARERRGAAAQRAEDILTNMIQLYHDGVDVDLNKVSFTSCSLAWARCQSIPDAPERAERLFDTLLDLHRESGDPKLKPDARSGNAVLTAWVNALNRADAMDRAFAVLEKLKAASKPDLVSYNLLLDGLGKRGMSDEALDLLKRLEADDTLPSPDIISFNCTLRALAKDGRRRDSFAAATYVFQRLDSFKLEPDVRSFTYFADALARSSESKKAEKFRVILSQLLTHADGNKRLQPDTAFYSVVIKGCARTRGSSEDKRLALELALEIFNGLLENGPIDQAVFSMTMTAVKNLVDDERRRIELLSIVFSQCCERGYASEEVVRVLDKPTLQLEPSWSRNVRRSKSRTYKTV